MAQEIHTIAELHQFIKEEYGNGRGRKDRSQDLKTLFTERAFEKVKVMEDGREITITRAEALIRQIYRLALQRNRAGLRLWVKLKEMEQAMRPAKQESRPLLVLPMEMSMEEMMARYRKGEDGRVYLRDPEDRARELAKRKDKKTKYGLAER